jgi:hypothetical protein
MSEKGPKEGKWELGVALVLHPFQVRWFSLAGIRRRKFADHFNNKPLSVKNHN